MYPQGTHATYDVSLVSQDGSLINYAEPFTVIPTKGYQESSFMITVIDTAKLDYEDPQWQQFDIIVICRIFCNCNVWLICYRFQIQSQEEDFANHSRQFVLRVILNNWNDEFPIFNNTVYSIDVEETRPENQILTTITAEDRDIGDEVRYKIFFFFYSSADRTTKY